MTEGTRITADNYPDEGPGAITQLDGKWAVVTFDSGATAAGIHIEDLTPATKS